MKQKDTFAPQQAQLLLQYNCSKKSIQNKQDGDMEKKEGIIATQTPCRQLTTALSTQGIPSINRKEQ